MAIINLAASFQTQLTTHSSTSRPHHALWTYSIL